MNTELKIKGITNFMGMELPNIYGGFGQDKKCILAKTVAEIHGEELKRINQIINRNRTEFEDGVDILDLKQTVTDCNRSENLINMLTDVGYSSQNIKVSSNIYLLSEQGYMALVMLMRTDKAKEIRKQLRREYFAMREIIQSDEQLKKELVYKLYGGGIQAIEASKQLMAIETKKVKEDTVKALKPTIDIAETFIQTKDSYDIGTFSKVLGIKSLGRNKMFAYLRNIDVFKSDNLPYARYEKYFEVKYTIKADSFGNSRNFVQSRINAQGMKYILKRLEKDGFIITKTVDQIVAELTDIENKEVA